MLLPSHFKSMSAQVIPGVPANQSDHGHNSQGPCHPFGRWLCAKATLIINGITGCYVKYISSGRRSGPGTEQNPLTPDRFSAASGVTSQKQLADQPADPLQPNNGLELDIENAISRTNHEQLPSGLPSDDDLEQWVDFLNESHVQSKPYATMKAFIDTHIYSDGEDYDGTSLSEIDAQSDKECIALHNQLQRDRMACSSGTLGSCKLRLGSVKGLLVAGLYLLARSAAMANPTSTTTDMLFLETHSEVAPDPDNHCGYTGIEGTIFPEIMLPVDNDDDGKPTQNFANHCDLFTIPGNRLVTIEKPIAAVNFAGTEQNIPGVVSFAISNNRLMPAMVKSCNIREVSLDKDIGQINNMLDTDVTAFVNNLSSLPSKTLDELDEFISHPKKYFEALNNLKLLPGLSTLSSCYMRFPDSMPGRYTYDAVIRTCDLGHQGGSSSCRSTTVRFFMDVIPFYGILFKAGISSGLNHIFIKDFEGFLLNDYYKSMKLTYTLKAHEKVNGKIIMFMSSHIHPLIKEGSPHGCNYYVPGNETQKGHIVSEALQYGDTQRCMFHMPVNTGVTKYCLTKGEGPDKRICISVTYNLLNSDGSNIQDDQNITATATATANINNKPGLSKASKLIGPKIVYFRDENSKIKKYSHSRYLNLYQNKDEL